LRFKKEIVVGFVVLIAIGLLYFGFNYLKGSDIFASKRQYYAVYNQIDGLTVDNPVQINGFRVGRVNSAELSLMNKGNIIIGFEITEERIQIPKKSTAMISSIDLLGSKAIVLTLSDETEIAAYGDTLIADIEEDLKSVVDKRIAPLEKKTKELISSIDSAVTIVQAILDKDARESLSESFYSIKRALRSLENTAFQFNEMVSSEREKVEKIFSNVESISENLRRNNTQINNVISNLSEVTDSLAASNLKTTIFNANKAIKNITVVIEKVNAGQGTMGQLVNNDTLYNNLEQATLELDKLLEDMRVNPKRYVHFSIFGKNEKEKDKPEKKPR
jgi:phospholipid/cholesterol/gamma-HCH transport system substrate-binding protein